MYGLRHDHNLRPFRAAAAAALFLAAATAARAGTISYLPMNTDADTGISSANQSTYTHLLDFGSSPDATINSVTFTKAGTTGTGFTYAVSSGSATAHAGNSNTGVSGSSATGLNTLLTDMIYDGNNAAGGTATLTLAGLTGGQAYDTRIYTRQWAAGTRNVVVTFNGDGTNASTPTINGDDATTVGFASATQAYALDYKFTASGTSETITFTQAGGNASWHIYGVTNQAVPEPASLGVIGLGAAGLLARRRGRIA